MWGLKRGRNQFDSGIFSREKKQLLHSFASHLHWLNRSIVLHRHGLSYLLRSDWMQLLITRHCQCGRSEAIICIASANLLWLLLLIVGRVNVRWRLRLGPIRQAGCSMLGVRLTAGTSHRHAIVIADPGKVREKY